MLSGMIFKFGSQMKEKAYFRLLVYYYYYYYSLFIYFYLANFF